MARAQDQQRWRARTARRRIEVYLPIDVVAALDDLARASKHSRAAAVEALVRAAAPAAHSDIDRAGEEPEVGESPATGTTVEYRVRRPRAADERRYEWIADVPATEDRIGLRPDPAGYHRWQGYLLGGSLTARPALGQSRSEVVEEMIRRDYLYR